MKVRNIYPSSLVKQHSESEDDYWHDTVATRALIPWFQSCWKKAGGAKFSRRAAIASHDTTKRLDLRTGKWRKM